MTDNRTSEAEQAIRSNSVVKRFRRNSDAVEAAPFEGPWMVFIERNSSGECAFKFYQHTHATVAIDRTFWPEDATPEKDDDGYYVHDENCAVSRRQLAMANALADMSSLLAAICYQKFFQERLIEEVSAGRKSRMSAEDFVAKFSEEDLRRSAAVDQAFARVMGGYDADILKWYHRGLWDSE